MSINLEGTNEYVFPSAYGGAVKSTKPPQIHDMMGALRREVGAVKAVRAQGGPQFPVRGAKDLAQKLANALNTLNMAAPVVAQEVRLIDTDKIPGNQSSSGKPVFRTLAHVTATVRLTAPDTSFIDLVGSGHGGDVDDKSGGKASTYAWKDALLKGLSIPHEDMVDTDDDSSTGDGGPGPGGKTSRTRPAKGGADAAAKNSAKAAGAGSEPVVGSAGDPGTVNGAACGEVHSQLDAALKAIAEANSKAALETIRDAIKSGAMELHGADRLSATKAFVARQKELS